MNEQQYHPHNNEAELGILNAVMVLPSRLDELPTSFHGGEFFDPTHGHIWNAMRELWSKGTSPNDLSVVNYMAKQGIAITTEKLEEIRNTAPLDRGIESYVSLIRAGWLKRIVIDIAANAAAAATDPTKTAEEAQEVLLRGIDRMDILDDTLVTASDAVNRVVARLRMRQANPDMYLDTLSPWANLNAILRPLEPQEVYILAARPGVGKSAMLMQWLIKMAERGVPCAMHSLEMSEAELLSRAAAVHSGINSQRVLSGDVSDDELDTIVDVMENHLAKLPLYMDTVGEFTTTNALVRARAAKARYGIRVLGVDYLQLMEGDSKHGRVTEVTEVSRALKNIARSCEITVMAAAQLNRNLEHREDRRPRNSDLRESGQIEQDASVILMLHRLAEDLIEVIKTKDRNGLADVSALLGFVRTTTRFQDVDKTPLEDLITPGLTSVDTPEEAEEQIEQWNQSRLGF